MIASTLGDNGSLGTPLVVKPAENLVEEPYRPYLDAGTASANWRVIGPNVCVNLLGTDIARRQAYEIAAALNTAYNLGRFKETRRQLTAMENGTQ